MQIALAQWNLAWEDRKANYQRARAFAERAATNGAGLFVLPEMFATGFSMNPAFTREPLDGETASFVRSLASDLRLAVVAGLVLEGENGRGRNSALAVDKNGNDLAIYTKTHLFSFADEQAHHQAGDGAVVFELEGLSCACYICYDLRFPELFRQTAAECHAIFVIASWPRPRQKHWDALLLARAVENQQYVIGVNRIGHGGGLDYSGGSAVYDPQGNTVAAAGNREGLFTADIEKTLVVQTRESMPFLNDRRF